MIALGPAAGTRLEWHQPRALQRYYELMAEEQVSATLRFEKICGTLATAEYGGQRWTFKRTGFWSPRVSVRVAGTATDIALFTPRWKGGGELVCQSGRRFILKSISFWGGEWAFETQDGSEVVSIHGPHGLMHASGTACIGLPAGSLVETPLLLLLIWYLRLLMQEDNAAAVVCCG